MKPWKLSEMEQGKALGVFVDFSRIDTLWIARAHTLDRENLIPYSFVHSRDKRPRPYRIMAGQRLAGFRQELPIFVHKAPCPSGKAAQTRLRRSC
jgi:hypothetical protein